MNRGPKSCLPLLGTAFGVAGLDKLIGLRAYRRLARHWRWRDADMRLPGAAELTGGALLTCRRTQRLGGGVLVGASAAALAAEARHRDTALLLPADCCSRPPCWRWQRADPEPPLRPKHACGTVPVKTTTGGIPCGAS